MGDAAQCKGNFLQGLKDISDIIFICRGILAIVPGLGVFSFIWDMIIDYNMKVVEAQYLCWSSQAPEETKDIDIEYEKFKNFIEFAEVYNQIYFVGGII